MGLDGERDIVLGGEIQEYAGHLERPGQAEHGNLVGRQPGDVVAVEDDLAAVRLQGAAQLGDQRRLAGAVRADDGVNLAALDPEIDIPDRVDLAETLGKIADFEVEVSHPACLRSAPPAASAGWASRRNPPQFQDQAQKDESQNDGERCRQGDEEQEKRDSQDQQNETDRETGHSRPIIGNRPNRPRLANSTSSTSMGPKTIIQ